MTLRRCGGWEAQGADLQFSPVGLSVLVRPHPPCAGSGRKWWFGALAIAGLLFTACSWEVQLNSPTGGHNGDTMSVDTLPPDSTTDSTGGQDIQRATLTVRTSVQQDLEVFQALADLGMTDSAVPGAEVQTQRRQSLQIATAVTDSAGVAVFTGLLTGIYDVAALRLLTPAERALLRPELRDVTGFGGGGTVNVVAPQTTVTIPTVLGRRGSLVISEVWDHAPLLAADNAYASGMYLEVYNNADTIIHLDRKLIGWGPIWGWNTETTPCSETAPWQLDPDGLWSPMLMRLPGTGRQYPLLPGEAAVIAVDAIDHSAVDPRLPNLTTARFETVGPTDVDNPAVPNAEIIVQEFEFFGRGILFIGGLTRIYFVADTVDLAAVQRARPDVGNYDELWVRVPHERILDVYAAQATASVTATVGGDDFCDPMILAELDSRPGRFFDGHGFYSIIRTSLGVFDGRAMLQRTRTSAADFVRSEQLTPGRVP